VRNSRASVANPANPDDVAKTIDTFHPGKHLESLCNPIPSRHNPPARAIENVCG
jgi:hypothetical protein